MSARPTGRPKSGQSTRRQPTKRASDRPNDLPAWVLLLALLLVTLAAYYPAWHGGLLWDDDAHITRVDLRSLHGLSRIWFDIGATQRYYPVTHSAFWVLHRLFGDATLGYHLLNISLHATAAFLFAVILRRLAVPGAVLAAFIFALHPVHVESVAWITELKNTLSGVLYLSAALAYLRFDMDRRRQWYALALGLFALALLSKTVTATLPAALLVVFWWQRGQLRLREDVLPLLPFFAFGIIGGAVTSWVERTHIGAAGAAFDLSLIERALIAGRAIWFYLAKLVWPANLVFVYPRWNIDSSVLVAVSVSPGCRPSAGRAVAVPDAIARPAGGTPVVHRHPGPGTGLRQRLPICLFLRRGSFSVPGEPRNHRAHFGRSRVADAALARDTHRGCGARGFRGGSASRRLDLAPEPAVHRWGNALPRDAARQSLVSNGAQQPWRAAAETRRSCQS